MSKPRSAPPGTSATTRLWTTMLACGWGLASAYTLFHSFLVTHDTRLTVAAIVPLITVWAVLERKRWGRLALLGLSATALGLLLFMLGGATNSMTTLPEAEKNLAGYMDIALSSFGNNPQIALIVFVLALSTGYWMRRPAVVAEFERGKRSTLAVAQKAIAMSLVAFWGVTVLLVPGGENKIPNKPKANAPGKPKPDHPKPGEKPNTKSTTLLDRAASKR